MANEDNQAFIKQWLINKGYNQSQIAGIMGNLHGESGFDNTVQEDYQQKEFDVNDGVGVGLAQWTYSTRKQALLDYANSKGTSVYDLETQLEFLDQEIDPDLKARMANATVEEAVKMFLYEYENPDKKEEVYLDRLKAGYQSISDIGSDVVRTFSSGAKDPTGSTNYLYGDLNTEIKKAPTFLETFIESGKDTLYDSILGSGLRQLTSRISTGAWIKEKGYAPSEEDRVYLDTILKGDKVAQDFVMLNANNRQHFMWLASLKKDDYDRRQNIARNATTWGNVARISGTLAGAVLDPINWIPVANNAKALSVLTKLFPKGIVTSSVSLAKVANFANKPVFRAIDVGVQQAGLNLLAGKATEIIGGFEQDYEMLAGAGVVFGGGLHYLADVFKRPLARTGADMEAKITMDKAESDSLKALSGQLPDNIKLTLTKEQIDTLADPHFASTLENVNIKKLADSGNVLFISKEDLKKISKAQGVDIPDNAKALFSKEANAMLVVRETAPKGKEMDRLLAHELGVHGMQQLVGDTAYKNILNYVSSQMTKEGSVWESARKMSHSGTDPEETLGYFMEHFADTVEGTEFMGKVKANMYRGLKNFGLDAKFSKEELKDIVQKAMQHQVDNSIGITTRNPDGSVVFGHIKLSRDNPFNPDMFNENLRNAQVLAETQGNLPLSMQKMMKAIETSGWSPASTFFGRFVNSESPTMRKYTYMLFDDPQRTRGVGLDAETFKERELRRLSVPIVETFDAIKKVKRKAGYKDIDDVMLDAIEVYDKTHNGYSTLSYGRDMAEVPTEVMEVVKAMERHRKAELEFMEQSSSRYGSKYDNLIETEGKIKDTGFYVSIDPDKLHSFNRNFDTLEQRIQWWTDYFKTYTDRKAYKTHLEERLAESYKVAKEKLQAKGKDVSKLKSPVVHSEMLENLISTGAESMAKHMDDIDDIMSGTKIRKGDLQHLKFRMPVNRGGMMKTPFGVEASFNTHARNLDITGIQTATSSRTVGEGAFRAVFGDSKNFAEVDEKIAKEISQANLSRYDKERALKEWRSNIDDLRGFRNPTDDIDRLSAWAKVMSRWSYFKSGANMTWGHLGEVMTTMGRLGANNIANTMPFVNKIFGEIKYGKDKNALLNMLTQEIHGRKLTDYVFKGRGVDYQINSKFNGSNRGDRYLRFFSDISVKAGRMTSFLNQLPELTYQLQHGIKKTIVNDTINWAGGTNLETRGLFHSKLLRRAGITTDNMGKLKEDINKYIAPRDTEFDIRKSIEDWRNENVDTYNQWYTLVNNGTNLIMVNPNRAGDYVNKNANAFTRLFFQFKDFPMRAVSSQVLSAFTLRDKGAWMSMLYSMVGNGAVYATQTTLKAHLMFGDNEEKRKQYIERTLSPSRIFIAGLLRSSIGTPLSFGVDMYEGVIGTQSIRNTVNRYFDPTDETKTREANLDPSMMAGRVVSQMPSFDSTIAQPIKAMTGIVNLSEERANKKDLNNVLQVVTPNWIPFMALQSAYVEGSGLPEKRPKKQKE